MSSWCKQVSMLQKQIKNKENTASYFNMYHIKQNKNKLRIEEKFSKTDSSFNM